MAELIAVSSESDSDKEMDTLILSHIETAEVGMEKRKTHGEFALTSEFSDKQFTNYFRLNRSQFSEVHRLVQNSICAEGCNAQ
jgi:hypothetical protein